MINNIWRNSPWYVFRILVGSFQIFFGVFRSVEDESAEYQFCESRQLNMSTLRMTAEAKVRSNPVWIIRSFIDQNERGGQYPAVILDLAWSITHISYLVGAPQVSPLNTMPPCVCQEVIALNLARDAHMGRNLSDGRENKYTCFRITGQIRQAGVKLRGAASIFKRTAQSCRYETS